MFYVVKEKNMYYFFKSTSTIITWNKVLMTIRYLSGYCLYICKYLKLYIETQNVTFFAMNANTYSKFNAVSSSIHHNLDSQIDFNLFY